MKYLVWMWNNVFLWIVMAATAFFSLIGLLTFVAAPYLRCGVVQ